jgi:hypothetical protein
MDCRADRRLIWRYSVVTLLGVVALALGVTVVAAMLVTMTASRKRGAD